MRPHDRLHDRQTQTRAAEVSGARSLGAPKWGESLRLVSGTEAGTTVGDDDPRASVDRPSFDLRLAAARRVWSDVRQQGLDALLHAKRVHDGRRRP
jgi:hypothetical protein